MDDLNKKCNIIKDSFLNSAPDIWEKIRQSAIRQIAEQLIDDLNGIPSNCGKLVYEQVNEIPVIRRVA